MINLGICDDEKALANLIELVAADFFETHNIDCNIIVTHDPDEFLEHKDEYDIVITDVDLHNVTTGIDAVAIMQETNKTAKVAIMSADDHTEEAQRVEHIKYIFKPFDINVITALLEETIAILPTK